MPADSTSKNRVGNGIDELTNILKKGWGIK